MSPDLLLHIATALAGFVLKTTLAFGVCWIISRIIVSPRIKFLIWLSFLFGAGAYWLWLTGSLLIGGSPEVLTQSSSIASSARGWQIPISCVGILDLTFRAVGICYLLTLVYFLVTQTRKQLHLRWVLRFTSKPPREVAQFFEKIAESLHVRHSRLLVLSDINSPATFGWVLPTVLVPAVCLKQERSELEYILRHELHHVRRKDALSNELAAVVRSLLFFHPAIWYAFRRLQFQRELACDLAVVSDCPERRVEYAECLIRFARLTDSATERAWGLDFAASSSHLWVRIHAVLAKSDTPSRRLLCLRIACGLLLFVGFLSILPSIAIVLSYSREQMMRPLPSVVDSRDTILRKHTTVGRRKRLSAIEKTPASAEVALETVSGPEAIPLEVLAPVNLAHPDSLYASHGTQGTDIPIIVDPEPSSSSQVAGPPPPAPKKKRALKVSVATALIGAITKVGKICEEDKECRW